jgi:hypothetical protein
VNPCPRCHKLVPDPEWQEYHCHEDCWVTSFVPDKEDTLQLTPDQRRLLEEVRLMEEGKPKRPVQYNHKKQVKYGEGNIRKIPASFIRGVKKYVRDN